MAGGGSPMKAILYAFLANLGIAIAKLVGFFVTGSSSMLAETIHSFADTTNQVLLALGIKQSAREPDAEHPLGYGKATYFWSFIVALMLFSLGGLFSLYEGYHKLAEPGPVENGWIALVILALAIVLEGLSMWGCMREIKKIRGARKLWPWLKTSRHSELVVVFGEDFGALVGLVLAFVFLSIAVITGNGAFDAYGSMAIGVVLLFVAMFVAVRVQSLLLGQSAEPELQAAIEDVIAGDADIVTVYNVITLQMGPQVVLAAKVRLNRELSIDQACQAINRLERELRERFPNVRWSFFEPDIED